MNKTTLQMLPSEMLEYICWRITSAETLLQLYIAFAGLDREKRAIEYVLRRTSLSFSKPALAELAQIPAKQLTQIPEDIFYHLFDNTNISFYDIGRLLKDHTKEIHNHNLIMWTKYLNTQLGHVRKNWHIVNLLNTYAIRRTVRKDKIRIYERVDGYNLFTVQELFFHPLYPEKTTAQAHEEFLSLCKHLTQETLIKYLDTLFKYLVRYDKDTHPLYTDPHIQSTIGICKMAKPLVETVLCK